MCFGIHCKEIPAHRTYLHYLLGPLDDPDLREAFILLLSKELPHMSLDQSQRDPCHRLPSHVSNHVCHSARSLQNHTRRAVQHGIVDGLLGHRVGHPLNADSESKSVIIDFINNY